MEVRPDRGPDTAALVPRLPVVPEPGDHAAEWHRTRVEECPSGVVLEAGERAPVPRLELALEQDIADHAPLARHRLVGEETRPGRKRRRTGPVAAAEELVAAAHGEQRGAAGHRLPDRVALAARSGATSACSRSCPPPT